ncbi:uncharacterized protein TNCV_1104691 [Trichonephila clavipes]|nr:uncharacterized protein TNCV_1104691 [Trichonephila clavipes]
MNETTQQEKTQLSSRNEQLISAAGTKQLNSAAGTNNSTRQSVFMHVKRPMSLTDENISIYERKILRFVFGGIQENGTWRKRSNLELYQSYKESDIVNFMVIQRIKWTRHVVRMDQNCTTKKVYNAQPTGTRRKAGQIIDGLMS